MNLLAYWNINAAPFEPVSEHRFFFNSREHREALARLSYLVNEQSMYFAMLTGEIGCGKSMTRKVFASGLDPARHAVVHFENSHFPFTECMAGVFAALNLRLAPQASLFEIFAIARKVLEDLATRWSRQLVLVFDEAQDMQEDCLANLKRLSNLNDESRGRLTIVLIGQPELRERVAAFPALDQRISLRYHICALAADEVGPYLAHRLRVAGHPAGDLFSPQAVASVFHCSLGVPREINRLAKLTLEVACAAGSPRVEAVHVATVVEDLRRHQAMPALTAPI